MQGISSKTDRRRYISSSSFKMAMLFTVMLGPCVLLLSYLAYSFYQRNAMQMFILSLSAIFLMLMVILISFFISTFVVSRTNRIASTAKEIMDTGNLSQRIGIDSKWDDLSYLSGVLNAFLSRMEDLVEGVQRVSDNIAHDLRTPLMRLRNNLERIKEAQDEKSMEVAEELIAEADHLLVTFNALLRITRIETEQSRNNFIPLELEKIIGDVIELYEPVAEQKGVSIESTGSHAVVSGDRDLLFQAFANVFDNAIKFSPPDGLIRVTLGSRDGHVVCSVSDQGTGIPDQEKEKVFTRFYRGDISRNTRGNGLGLSLVAAVIRLHDGDIILEDADPGLRVKTIL